MSADTWVDAPADTFLSLASDVALSPQELQQESRHWLKLRTLLTPSWKSFLVVSSWCRRLMFQYLYFVRIAFCQDQKRARGRRQCSRFGVRKDRLVYSRCFSRTLVPPPPRRKITRGRHVPKYRHVPRRVREPQKCVSRPRKTVRKWVCFSGKRCSVFGRVSVETGGESQARGEKCLASRGCSQHGLQIYSRMQHRGRQSSTMQP